MNRNKIGKVILTTTFVLLITVFIFGLGYLTGSLFNGGGSSGNDTPADLNTLNSVKSLLQQEFLYGEDTDAYSDKLIDDAIRGMVDAQKDPYTVYMSAEELNEFTSSLTANFVGIGVRYSELEDGILVSEVLDFSPAQAAGVQAGDIIVAVDGRDVKTFESEELLNAIRGLKGTDVTITVQRGNDRLDITITRDEIYTTVSSRVDGKVGILTFNSFADGSVKEMKQHLDKLKKAGVTSLIIDLRDNGGGYVSTLDGVSAYFMKKGDIIMREIDRYGYETIDRCKSGPSYLYDRIVILINNNSASCSEVFTMAMIENCGAITVGDVSYGKGVAQVTQMLKNGGALKYTDLKWVSPSGVSVSGTGIKPDYEVRLHEALYMNFLTLDEGETYQYDSVSEKLINLQYMLDFLGYDVDRLDGYFSQKTAEALTAFQKASGLNADGILNSATATRLNSAVVTAWGLQREKYDTQMQKALEVARGE
ncbi:MAG: S41 family peptidase [Erysipelotrichaceae bacterium]|nr:S41 family peptidase [Erysipelotrichaceae bacterium]